MNRHRDPRDGEIKTWYTLTNATKNQIPSFPGALTRYRIHSSIPLEMGASSGPAISPSPCSRDSPRPPSTILPLPSPRLYLLATPSPLLRRPLYPSRQTSPELLKISFDLSIARFPDASLRDHDNISFHGKTRSVLSPHLPNQSLHPISFNGATNFLANRYPYSTIASPAFGHPGHRQKIAKVDLLSVSLDP